MKTALVMGAGGFIGTHMVNRLRSEGYWVRGVDLKPPEFSISSADEFLIADLRDRASLSQALSAQDTPSTQWTDVYQFAADMGGAGFVFTGDNDANVMHNSALINLNLLELCTESRAIDRSTRIFYSSSACIYPARNQVDPLNPNCSESSAYPAEPDSEYGWEKLFSERLYAAFARNYGLNIRVARYHNIYGPLGTWEGGREKAPAAICRKVAMAHDKGDIEIWGSGEQTRSFLYIDDCIQATRLLVESNHREPINIGSEEMVSINQLVALTCEVAGKSLRVRHVDGPIGVNGRNSDNSIARRVLGWDAITSLSAGISQTYTWILEQVVAKSAPKSSA